MDTRICSICKEEKPVDLFSKHSARKSGYQPYCKPCAHTKRVDWARNNKDKGRQYKLKYDYKMSVQTFDKMVKDQDNKCAICSEDFTTTPCIDHDHSCCGPKKACEKCVRGLLCTRCNVIVGVLETFKYLPEAEDYINNHASVPVAVEQSGLLPR